MGQLKDVQYGPGFEWGKVDFVVGSNLQLDLRESGEMSVDSPIENNKNM